MNDYLRDVRFDGEGRNNESLEREIKNAKMTYKEKREEANLEQWKNHTFAKHHKNILDEAFIDTYKSNEVMIKGWLKSEDERTILAAQDQALRTNWFKKHIEGQNITDKCRMCSGGSESVCHILSECKFLLKKGTYTERHNNICRLIHYRLCRKFEIEVNTVNHWEHNPNNIEENNRVLILYDYNIPTDAQVSHNKPDIVIYNKTENKCLIIEVGVPWDGRVSAYEIEKEMKYQRLKYELRRLWNIDIVEIVPAVSYTHLTLP